MIGENIARLKTSVAEICRVMDRDPEEITIIGVTKYSDAAHIQEAVDAGLKHIGENRIQQAATKYADLAHVTKHMIGHLQTNKVKQAIQLFDMIQSVDSLYLAQEIDRQCEKLGRSLDVLLQVNTSGEAQKFGVAPEKVWDLLAGIGDCKNLTVQGFMTIGPLADNEIKVRDCFKRLKEIFVKAKADFSSSKKVQMRYLSMGMSDDYKIALQEGSNMLRIGRAIFQ